MRWIKKHKTQSAAAAAVGIGALVMLFALGTIIFGGSTATATSDRPFAQPTLGAPLYVEPDDLGLADDPTTVPADQPAGLPPLGSSFNGGFGLAGEGGIVGLPKMTIELRMTSSAPIPYVGYVVPTSLNDSSGADKNPGTNWSRRMIGYGKPDYAQLFSISGPAGIPITCTITVNGKVTEKRTTTGPYDQMFCQG